MRRAFGLGIQYFDRVAKHTDIDKIVKFMIGAGRENLPIDMNKSAGVYDFEVGVDIDEKVPEMVNPYEAEVLSD